MNVGVISDIHANKPALEAVLDQLTDHEVDTIVCVGDVMGVLGWPEETASLIRTHADATVYGNHDTRFFPNRDWLPQRDVEIAEHKQVTESLSTETQEWLTSLPGMTTVEDCITLAHSRPDPDAPEGGHEYDDGGVRPKEFVSVGSDYFTADDDGCVLCLGHTHYQHAVALGKFEGQPDALVVNPGSVGFPYNHTHDGDTLVGKASYTVIDMETLNYDQCAVEYDATPVETHLEDCGLLSDADRSSTRRRESMYSRI